MPQFLLLFLVLFLLPASLYAEPLFRWEITNRFAPFETQADPDGLFEKYKVPKGEDLESWHRSLSEGPSGMQSPYLSALRNKDQYEVLMHWSQNRFTHHPKILKFIRDENDPTTTVRIGAWVENADNCIWPDLSPDVVSCATNQEFSVPLSGETTLRVEVDGEMRNETVEPQHVVIVGLGDSYGSGEGNPDYPAVWKDRPSYITKWGFTWLKRSQSLKSPQEGYGKEQKHWVDDNCHRSFFSHQSLTALRIASENPDTFVSFLHYACTGAEIFDGILVPQYQAWGEGIYLPFSQLNLAIRELCIDGLQQERDYMAISAEELDGIDIKQFHRRGGKGNTRELASDLIPHHDNFAVALEDERKKKGGLYPNSGILDCDPKAVRAPDLLFLSVGGNDIGFADVVRYHLVPAEWDINKLGDLLYPDVCPSLNNRVDPEKYENLAEYCEDKTEEIGYDAGTLIGAGSEYGMMRRYELLFNILETRLNITPEKIVMAQYPDPLRDKAPSVACDVALPDADLVVPGDPAGRRADSAWNGLKTAAKNWQSYATALNMWRWQFNLRPDEARLALRQFDEFRVVLAAAAKERGITFACETRDAFLGHGWWQGRHLNLPNGSGPVLDAWELNDWHPYVFEEDARAIRTGNDSALSQPGDKQITGSVHPNLTGHRLIAEGVYRAMTLQ